MGDTNPKGSVFPLVDPNVDQARFQIYLGNLDADARTEKIKLDAFFVLVVLQIIIKRTGVL